jgi:hypothetical protein
MTTLLQEWPSFPSTSLAQLAGSPYPTKLQILHLLMKAVEFDHEPCLEQLIVGGACRVLAPLLGCRVQGVQEAAGELLYSLMLEARTAMGLEEGCLGEVGGLQGTWGAVIEAEFL